MRRDLEPVFQPPAVGSEPQPVSGLVAVARSRRQRRFERRLAERRMTRMKVA
jgi:hypothetical protein